MPVIRCTSKLLAQIDDLPSAGATVSAPSAVGDWYANVFTVERRKCLLFVNEPTLFVCLAVGIVKAEYRRIAPFFLDLLARTLRQEGFARSDVALIFDLHNELAVGRTLNRSTVASLNNRAIDAKFIMAHSGGVEQSDVVTVTHLLNQTPMKPIGYLFGLEKMAALVERLRRG